MALISIPSTIVNTIPSTYCRCCRWRCTWPMAIRSSTPCCSWCCTGDSGKRPLTLAAPACPRWPGGWRPGGRRNRTCWTHRCRACRPSLFWPRRRHRRPPVCRRTLFGTLRWGWVKLILLYDGQTGIIIIYHYWDYRSVVARELCWVESGLDGYGVVLYNMLFILFIYMWKLIYIL